MKSGSHIILAEDNAADVFLVRAALQDEGIDCQLQVLSDGEEVLRFLEVVESEDVSCPEMMILDLNLPKRNGEEILKGVRKSNRCSSLPIIILTSSDSPKDKERVARLGIAHYFRKPIDLDEFM